MEKIDKAISLGENFKIFVQNLRQDHYFFDCLYGEYKNALDGLAAHSQNILMTHCAGHGLWEEESLEQVFMHIPKIKKEIASISALRLIEAQIELLATQYEGISHEINRISMEAAQFSFGLESEKAREFCEMKKRLEKSLLDSFVKIKISLENFLGQEGLPVVIFNLEPGFDKKIREEIQGVERPLDSIQHLLEREIPQVRNIHEVYQSVVVKSGFNSFAAPALWARSISEAIPFLSVIGKLLNWLKNSRWSLQEKIKFHQSIINEMAAEQSSDQILKIYLDSQDDSDGLKKSFTARLESSEKFQELKKNLEAQCWVLRSFLELSYPERPDLREALFYYLPGGRGRAFNPDGLFISDFLSEKRKNLADKESNPFYSMLRGVFDSRGETHSESAT